MTCFQNSVPFKRYFCIFCTEKFSDRTEAIDHYSDELNIKLKCSDCPLNTFQSLDQYLNHRSGHNPFINKSPLIREIYSSSKSWINSLIEYMDSLSDPIRVQKEIDQKYGDCCLVCLRLNVLTPDCQPFFHKNVFANNRVLMKSSVRAEVEFAQHMRKHLKYEPKYNCSLCVINKSKNIFTSPTIDEKCRNHLQEVHRMELQSAQMSDVSSFFGNTKISRIDYIIPISVQTFIIKNCNLVDN